MPCRRPVPTNTSSMWEHTVPTWVFWKGCPHPSNPSDILSLIRYWWKLFWRKFALNSTRHWMLSELPGEAASCPCSGQGGVLLAASADLRHAKAGSVLWNEDDHKRLSCHCCFNCRHLKLAPEVSNLHKNCVCFWCLVLKCDFLSEALRGDIYTTATWRPGWCPLAAGARALERSC